MEENIEEIIRKDLTSGLNFDWVQKFADTLNMDNFLSELGVATTFAHTLCGLFALFYVCKIVWKSWANGTQLDIYKCLKPFAIGMAIMFFGEIAAGVDFLANGIGKATQEFSNACSKKSEEQFDKVTGYVKNTNLTETKSKVSYDNASSNAEERSSAEDNEKAKEEDFFEFMSSIPGLVLQVIEKITNLPSLLTGAMWATLLELCILFASIISCCILCMGFIGKCVFYFFGPFLFAMELIPGMEGRIVGWFKKYLTFSLYPCILNLVNGVLSLLTVSLVETSLNTKFVKSVTAFDFQSIGFMGEVHFIVAFIGAFMFMSIPSVATQIMETASNALGGSGMVPVSFVAGKAGNQIASNIGKGAAAKATGGASEVVDAAAKMGKTASSESNFKG